MTGTNSISIFKKAYKYLFLNSVGIAPLATFRIAFGILMLISTIRFWYMGWIEQLYCNPTFFFKYYGFHWIPAPSETAIYAVFILLILSCICISLGLFYRFSILTFFLLFTYTELIDASNYLNHYYFISIIAFLLIFLPANKYFALDNFILNNRQDKVAAWQINIIKLQLGILYFYAGLAKLNSTWLFEALPLKIWLPSKVHLPVIGQWLSYNATAYLFSWGGALFDLSIFFLLIYQGTRVYAYGMVIVFHLLTWYLFPIGMFSFVMIASTLIFFSENSHRKIYEFVSATAAIPQTPSHFKLNKFSLVTLTFYISFQLLFPFRHVLYTDNLFWTEQGYRFSWRVMLMEKVGYATFTVKDRTGKIELVDNSIYLSPFQEKMMSTQADFIIQYANFLKTEYEQKGFKIPEIYADIFVSLNGAGSRRFIHPAVDLANLKDTFAPKKFILPF
ncbi:MAG: hypothetical protein ACI9O4_000348 [Chitinophagales bacterium]|jgi:hypothetical protein